MIDELESNSRVKVPSPKIRELHVDFLLEEEFCADPHFLKTFVKAAGQEHTPIDVVEVRHSASDEYGEADLLVVYTVDGGKKIGLLIEDKIRAVFQPDQASRYSQRRDAGIEKGTWDECWTCLVAPKTYISNEHGFDVALCLEEVKDWFATTEDSRHRFKVSVIERAIKKATETGVQFVDAALTQFRQSYYESLNDFFRSERVKATMRAPNESYKGETWFHLRSDLLPKGVYIYHKSDRGFLDLTFSDTDTQRLNDLHKYLEPGMKIEKTGKSSAIRLEVPRIMRFDDFEREKDKIIIALTEVARLLAFYDRERSQIESMFSLPRRSQDGSREGLASV